MKVTPLDRLGTARRDRVTAAVGAALGLQLAPPPAPAKTATQERTAQ